MEIKDALTIWCESGSNHKTRRTPERIGLYLKENKPVFYAPTHKDDYPNDFPIGDMELILSGENGMQDSYVQQQQLIERFRTTGIKTVEICGPMADHCLSWLRDAFTEARYNAEINMDYSTTMAEELHRA